MTAKDIEKACEQQLSYDYIINNVYFFENESDVLLIRKSGITLDFEIKCSIQDMKKDVDKPRHQHLLNRNQQFIANYFSYICPEFIIPLELVPEYAGLYYVSENGRIKEIKKSPKLHSHKHPYKEPLFNKLYYAYRESKDLKSDEEYKTLKKEIKSLENDIKRLEEAGNITNKSFREIISENRKLKQELKLVI